MSLERLPRLETERHPSQAFNLVLTYYALRAFNEGLSLARSPYPKKVLALQRHIEVTRTLEGGHLPKEGEFLKEVGITTRLADLQLKCALNGLEVRREGKTLFSPKYLAVSGNALLYSSYEDLYSNLAPVVMGKKTYGPKGDIRRDPERNSIGSGIIMERASSEIAKKTFELTENWEDVGHLELGGGAGNMSKKDMVIRRTAGKNFKYSLITDIAPKTEEVSQKNLESEGFVRGVDFGWMNVNMGGIEDLKKAKEILTEHGVKSLVIYIGYILHENRDLATRTLKAMKEVFGDMKVLFVFSEFEFQKDIVSLDLPWTFYTIHEITQEPFYRDEFKPFVLASGLASVNESDVPHNIISHHGNRIVTNYTSYWR